MTTSPGSHRRRRRVAAASAAVVVGEMWWAAPVWSLPGDGLVQDAVGGVASRVAGSIVEPVAGWVLGAVSFFAEGVVHFLGTSAAPDVGAVWFAGPGSPFASVRAVGLLLMIGFAFLAILQGLARGDAGMMLGRVAFGIPASVACTVAVVEVTAKLLALTDALSASVLDPAGGQATGFLGGFTVSTASLGTGFAVVLVAGLAALAGLALWAELLVRDALIYVLVALSPLAFASMIWPAARGTARRLVEILLAVVLSKFVISVVLAVGIAALHGTSTVEGGVGDQAARGLGQLLVGAVILGLAAFSPFLTLRLFPLVESANVGQGISRAPIRTAISGYYLASSVGRLAGGPARAAGSAGVVPAAVTATRAATAAYDLGRAAGPSTSNGAPQ